MNPTGNTTADLIFTGLLLVLHLAALAGLGYLLGQMHRPKAKPETYAQFRIRIMREAADALGIKGVPMPPVKTPMRSSYPATEDTGEPD